MISVVSNEKDVLFTAREMLMSEHSCSCRRARPTAEMRGHLVVVSCHCGFVTSYTVRLVVSVQRRVFANDNDNLVDTVARILEPQQPASRERKPRFRQAA